MQVYGQLGNVVVVDVVVVLEVVVLVVVVVEVEVVEVVGQLWEQEEDCQEYPLPV